MEDSPYMIFSCEQWQQYSANTPLTLTKQELDALQSSNDKVSLEQVQHIYLPLSRLLNLYVNSARSLHQATDEFLGHGQKKTPYIIGIAGSVAVGKSTTARLLQRLLQRWPSKPRVDLVTTDGFLLTNAQLEKQGIAARKGFPESYDQRRLLQFLLDLKSGKKELKVPLYSHLSYDIIPDQFQSVNYSDIVILEGLNILQADSIEAALPRLFVSDFFDFSIYVHAEADIIKHWFLERFHLFCQTAFKNKDSFFHSFSVMGDEEADTFARRVWQEINALNLEENILPTKNRAQLILTKGNNHNVQEVLLRKL